LFENTFLKFKQRDYVLLNRHAKKTLAEV